MNLRIRLDLLCTNLKKQVFFLTTFYIISYLYIIFLRIHLNSISPFYCYLNFEESEKTIQFTMTYMWTHVPIKKWFFLIYIHQVLEEILDHVRYFRWQLVVCWYFVLIFFLVSFVLKLQKKLIL